MTALAIAVVVAMGAVGVAGVSSLVMAVRSALRGPTPAEVEAYERSQAKEADRRRRAAEAEASRKREADEHEAFERWRASHGGDLEDGPAPAPVSSAVLERTWRHYTDLDADLHRRILDTETDWDVMFDRPMLRDVSAPVTQALFRAQRAVDLMADELKEVPSGLTVADDVTAQPYVKAVMALSQAWDEAWHESGRAGDHYLPERERRTLARIKQVIARIEDSGVGDAERASAYRALSGLVGELEHVEAAPRMLNQIEAARSALPDRLLPQKVEVSA